MKQWKKYYNGIVTITAVHTVIVMAYKIYVHYRSNKLTYINKRDFYNSVTPYKIFDFTNSWDKLSLIEFESTDKKSETGFFEYKGILFTLSHKNNSNEYTLSIDVEACKKLNKKVDIIAEKFIESINFSAIPVIWINPKKL